MALSATTLGGAIKTELDTAFGALTNDADRQKLADAIAAAVVNHIKNYASVSTTTTCGAGAGTGTGTVS